MKILLDKLVRDKERMTKLMEFINYYTIGPGLELPYRFKLWPVCGKVFLKYGDDSFAEVKIKTAIELDVDEPPLELQKGECYELHSRMIWSALYDCLNGWIKNGGCWKAEPTLTISGGRFFLNIKDKSTKENTWMYATAKKIGYDEANLDNIEFLFSYE